MELLELMKKHPITFLKGFYGYLQKTNDDDWQMNVCRTISDDGKERNCLLGHVCKYVQLNRQNNEVEIHDMEIFENFEVFISSPYQVYTVNDGKSDDYPQTTPKERCLAFILDIIHGKELLINDSFDDFYNQNLSEGKNPIIIDMSKYDPQWQPEPE